QHQFPPFLSLLRRAPCPPPLPYTTLFRSIPSANRVLARLFSECDDRGIWSPKSLRTMPKASSPLTAHYFPLEGLDALGMVRRLLDRKSTRLNSSHVSISYAVFCLKKKKHT